MKLPKIIATDVIRSAYQNESHGGIYLVDLEQETIQKMVDWDRANINFEGRGLDRGLRGIAFYDDQIYIAASDEIFVFNQSFTIIKSYKNQYLKHCHEINIKSDILYLTSTGFDSVLEFNLKNEKFTKGTALRRLQSTEKNQVNADKDSEYLVQAYFDPESEIGPINADTTHINYVFPFKDKILVSGVRLAGLYQVDEVKYMKVSPLPLWTHNAMLYKNGILYHSTARDVVCYQSLEGKIIKEYQLPRYNEEDLLNTHLPKDHARQAFGRGLCATEEGLIIVGSSPSTITVYDFESTQVIKSINLTMDIRNAIHGLEIFPF